MYIFNLSWNFFTRKAESNSFNFSSLLPMLGVALGTFTIILTFAIMDGLEKDIFGTLKIFSGGTIIKTNEVSKNDILIIEQLLEKNQIEYSDFIERKAIFQFNNESRILNIRAFSDLNIPLEKLLKNKKSYQRNSVIIGNELANRMNISILDSIKILSPLDLKFSSSIIPQENLIINDVFITQLLDFDLNYIYVPISVGEKIFKKSGNRGFYLKNEVDIPNSILEIKNIKIDTWDKIHGNLVSAMKLEKMAYVGFGFLLILISGFSLLSTMSISVIQKISQIGILKAMGFSNGKIKTLFFYFSFISGLMGVIIGVSISLIIKLIESNYPFFHFIFGNYPFLEFPMELNIIKIFWVSCCSILAIILASIFPAKKAAKLNPVYSIGMK